MADSVRISKIKFHYPAFNALRKDAGIEAELIRRGEAIAEAASVAGGSFVAEVSPSGSRARVIVIAADAEAIAGEATDRRLTRSLDAGRG